MDFGAYGVVVHSIMFAASNKYLPAFDDLLLCRWSASHSQPFVCRCSRYLMASAPPFSSFYSLFITKHQLFWVLSVYVFRTPRRYASLCTFTLYNNLHDFPSAASSKCVSKPEFAFLILRNFPPSSRCSCGYKFQKLVDKLETECRIFFEGISRGESETW